MPQDIDLLDPMHTRQYVINAFGNNAGSAMHVSSTNWLLAHCLATQVRGPTTWTITRYDGPNQLELWYNALPEHQMALITSDCAPFRRASAPCSASKVAASAPTRPDGPPGPAACSARR